LYDNLNYFLKITKKALNIPNNVLKKYTKKSFQKQKINIEGKKLPIK